MSDRVLSRLHFSRLRLVFLFLAGFAAGFLWRGAPDQTTPEPVDGLPLPPLQNASTEPITLRVNGTRYVIPLNYFRYPPEGGDAVESGLLLRVEWPNLTGYAPDWDDERVRGWGDRMNILVREQYGDDLRRLVGVHIQNLDILGDFPVHDGLYHAPIYKLEPLPREDIYFMRENGRFPFVLVCTRYERPDRWDSCSMSFIFRSTEVKVTFSQRFEQGWRTIRADVTHLLESFVAEQQPAPSAASETQRRTREELHQEGDRRNLSLRP